MAHSKHDDVHHEEANPRGFTHVDERAGASEASPELDLRIARWTLLLNTTGTACIAFFALILFRMIVPAAIAAPSTSKVEAIPCGEKETLIDGTCTENRHHVTQAQRLEACGDALPCEAGLLCQGGLCVSEDPQTRVCEDPETRKMLAKIIERHKKCKTDAKGKEAASCNHMDLQNFVVGNPRFVEMIEHFPNPLSVHFANSEPDIRVGVTKTRYFNNHKDHYLDQLEPVVKELKEADFIIVFARASGISKSDAQRRNNNRYTQQRLQAFRELLKLQGVDESKIREFTLLNDYPLSTNGFLKLKNRYILWDAGNQARLRGDREQLNKGGVLEGSEETWFHETINQSIVAFPVKCNLEEKG